MRKFRFDASLSYCFGFAYIQKQFTTFRCRIIVAKFIIVVFRGALNFEVFKGQKVIVEVLGWIKMDEFACDIVCNLRWP